MNKFPSYDLHSKRGAEVAIQDIESRLAIASLKDPKPRVCRIVI
jgi:hypothetical protein